MFVLSGLARSSFKMMNSPAVGKSMFTLGAPPRTHMPAGSTLPDVASTGGGFGASQSTQRSASAVLLESQHAHAQAADTGARPRRSATYAAYWASVNELNAAVRPKPGTPSHTNTSTADTGAEASDPGGEMATEDTVARPLRSRSATLTLALAPVAVLKGRVPATRLLTAQPSLAAVSVPTMDTCNGCGVATAAAAAAVAPSSASASAPTRGSSSDADGKAGSAAATALVCRSGRGSTTRRPSSMPAAEQARTPTNAWPSGKGSCVVRSTLKVCAASSAPSTYTIRAPGR